MCLLTGENKMVYKPMDTEAKALQGQARIYNEYSDNWEDSVREKFRYGIMPPIV